MRPICLCEATPATGKVALLDERNDDASSANTPARVRQAAALSAMIVALFSTQLLAGEQQVTAEQSQSEAETAQSAGDRAESAALSADSCVAGCTGSDNGTALITTGYDPFRSDSAVRFGWWFVGDDGDSVKVGEFQDLDSSPFWDVDSIFSGRGATLDFSATGVDGEGTQVRADYYGHGVRARIEYDRFLRRWDHEPIPGGPPTGTTQVVSEDLNVGEDYAIRVQELKASFRGNLTENVRWRLNLWGLRKFGERQADSMAHCFNVNFGGPGGSDNRCHILSRRQQIDWLTMEIEPVIEARLGRANVEYARTMRQFGQSDELVQRNFNHFGPFGGRGTFQTTFPFAIVPENSTQVDRLKVNIPLDECRHVYAYLYHGDTENEFRETHRKFSGFDARLIDRSINGVTLTGYAKMDVTDNELPGFLLPEEQDDPESIRHPVDYSRTRAGLAARWRPFRQCCSTRRLSINSRYEYLLLDRDFARYEVEGDEEEVFVQPPTTTHRIEIGPSMRWSYALTTFARYKMRLHDDPLFGLQPASGDVNSRLPEKEHLVEVGGSWTPTHNFLASAQIGIENRRHDSTFVDFVEDNYPIICTVWYAPTPKWSLSSGYGHYTNWIDQDITIGFRGPDEPPPAETLRWNYGGRSQVFSFGARYACTPRLQLSGGLEWARGSNVFSVPASATGADWSLLPGIANVIVETMRYRAGIDFPLSDRLTCYLRYNYFDYEDKSEDFNSGTAHFLLAGGTAAY